MITLKPCPLCKYGDVDNDEGIYKSGEFFVIRCGACFLTIDGRNKQELITRWNTRAPSKLFRAIAEIEDMIGTVRLYVQSGGDPDGFYKRKITLETVIAKLKRIEAGDG